MFVPFFTKRTSILEREAEVVVMVEVVAVMAVVVVVVTAAAAVAKHQGLPGNPAHPHPLGNLHLLPNMTASSYVK